MSKKETEMGDIQRVIRFKREEKFYEDIERLLEYKGLEKNQFGTLTKMLLRIAIREMKEGKNS